MLDRRQFGIGAAAAAASSLNFSTSAMAVLDSAALPTTSTGIAPLPVDALKNCNSMVQENARRLERIAREVFAAEQRFTDDPEARSSWPRLYEDMVYEACGLRHKGITGRSHLELRLLEWVGSIYPDDETSVRQPRAALSGLSLTYEHAHWALERELSVLSRATPPTDAHFRATMKAAWGVAGLIPETLDDIEAHRLAVDVLSRDSNIFIRRYGKTACNDHSAQT